MANPPAPIWVTDDAEWSGISDSRRRRTLQNRRNKRNYRRKQRQEKIAAVEPPGQAIMLRPLNPLPPPPPPPPPLSSLMATRMDLGLLQRIIDMVHRINVIDPASDQDNKRAMRDFEQVAYRHYHSRVPQLTLLPALSEFNFIRSLFANMEVLALTPSQMHDDALSPFNPLPMGPAPPSQEHEKGVALDPYRVQLLPPDLRPSRLQHEVPHHPWIDLLPLPRFRDNILTMLSRGHDTFDEDDLCHTLRGRVPGYDRPGALVWGQPWEASSWEVTADFMRLWAWSVQGCNELFLSTNAWRRKRGERPLFRC